MIILSEQVQNSFNNDRGVPLSQSAFEPRTIYLAAPENIRAFVVAPLTSYTGLGEDERTKSTIYTVNGVYALDEATLSQWKQEGRISILASAFHNQVEGTSNICTTRQAAFTRAQQINDMVYNAYMNDFQNGRLGGVTRWQADNENKASKDDTSSLRPLAQNAL